MVVNEMCIVLIDNFEIAELNIPTQHPVQHHQTQWSAVSAGTRRGSCRGHCGARRAGQPWSTCPQQDHNPAPHPLGCIAWLVSWSWRVSMLPPRLPTSSPSNIHIVVRQSFAIYILSKCELCLFGCESSPISRNVRTLVIQLVSQSANAK